MNDQNSEQKSRLELLRSPWAILAGVIIGLLVGTFLPEKGKNLGIIGELFLSYMTMCTLPVIVSAIISSLGGAFKSKAASKKLFSMFKFILLFSLLISSLSVGVFSCYELIFKVDKNSHQTLGTIVKTNADLSVVKDANKSIARLEFLRKLIPENIFAALSKGDIVGIIFFSIIMGVALGMLGCKSSQKLLDDFDAIFRACQVMLEWGLYFLPLGICSLIASQFANLGHDTFKAVLGLCGFLYLVAILVALIFWGLISKISGKTMKESFEALKRPLLIGVSTQDSLLAIPSLIDTFQENFNQDNDDSLKSTIPLTVLFCKAGSVIYLVAASVFFLVFLDQPVENTMVAAFALIFGSVVLSFGDSGGGMAIYSMLTVLLNYFGIPVSVAIPLLISFDFLFEPILIAVDIFAASTVALFQTREFAMIKKKKNRS